MYFKSDFGRRAASSWALPHISRSFLVTCARLSWPHTAFQSTLNSFSYRIVSTEYGMKWRSTVHGWPSSLCRRTTAAVSSSFWPPAYNWLSWCGLAYVVKVARGWWPCRTQTTRSAFDLSTSRVSRCAIASESSGSYYLILHAVWQKLQSQTVQP